VTGRVLVVGDLVTDVIAALTGPVRPGTDTPAQIRVAGGGQGGNTAAWLAHRGVPVTLVAAVGGDPAGRERLAELTTAGVDLAVRTVPGEPTGTLVVISTGRDRTMLADRGAAGELAPADIDAALAAWPDTRHLHLSGYVLLDEGTRPAGRHALATAAQRGLTTSVDAASAGPLRRVGPNRFLAWVRGVDLLLANAPEAAALAATNRAAEPVTGRAGAAAAGAVLARVATAGVVKLGAAGALWAGPNRVVRVTAPAVTVRDPTGAGDAFAAGLLAEWLAGAGPDRALRAGVALGAAAVASVGARPAASPGPAADR
jgi:sugar/nucleoside kinase (ribokinase family)